MPGNIEVETGSAMGHPTSDEFIIVSMSTDYYGQGSLPPLSPKAGEIVVCFVITNHIIFCKPVHITSQPHHQKMPF
jgi:hypothetical protein